MPQTINLKQDPHHSKKKKTIKVKPISPNMRTLRIKIVTFKNAEKNTVYNRSRRIASDFSTASLGSRTQ